MHEIVAAILRRPGTLRGEPTNRALEEHDGVGWFDLAEIRGLDLADERYREWFAEVSAPTWRSAYGS